MPRGYREHYIRDAQGNIMAIYKYTNSGTASTKVVERPIYGSSRLGSYALAQEVMVSSLVDYPFTQLLSDVHKRYELNDHLGNVNTVVSGRLLDGAGAGSPKQAEVITASGYEPFGALLPGRNWRQPIGTPPPPVTPQGTLVITEFSNGPGGDCEYVELYVSKCSLYPDATEVDIRGWIVDDNAGNFNTEGGCTTGVGISAGHIRFADVAAWSTVPVGTVIVLFNGPDASDNCYGFTVNESGTGAYFIEVNNTALVQRTGSGATPNGSGGDCGYCDNSYAATTASPNSWESVLSMSNTADAIQVHCPDCPESEAGFFHGIAYGPGTQWGPITAGANDLGGAHFTGNGTGRTYTLTGAGAPGETANWTRTDAPDAGTPPATAGVVDASVVAWLEGASLACCGSFEAPVLAQKQGYRFGFNGKENDNEWHGAVGTMQDYGMRAYDTRVGRFFAVDPITDEYPELTPYQFASLKPIWLVDIDGLEGGMLKRRPKPLLSNRFNGKGLIPWLGGSRGKYFRHSVLDMPSLLGRRKGNDRSNGNAGNPTDYAADPSRNAPDRDGRNDRDNNGGRIGLGRITPANISTDGVPIQLKPNKDNGTFDLEFDPGTYEDGTPASKSFEIGIMDAHGNVRGVQTTGPVSTPGTLNLDFDLKPGETLYYKTTATDPQRSSDGGIRGSARQREASDED